MMQKPQANDHSGQDCEEWYRPPDVLGVLVPIHACRKPEKGRNDEDRYQGHDKTISKRWILLLNWLVHTQVEFTARTLR
jgi:hypothetical protein